MTTELAKSISRYESLDQFKGYIRNTLLMQKQSEENNRFTDEVIDAVVAQSQIAYPASMLDDEMEQDLKRAQEYAQRLGLGWPKFLGALGQDRRAVPRRAAAARTKSACDGSSRSCS